MDTHSHVCMMLRNAAWIYIDLGHTEAWALGFLFFFSHALLVCISFHIWLDSVAARPEAA